MCDEADALAAAAGLHIRVSSLAAPPAPGAPGRGGAGAAAAAAAASPVPGREAAPGRAGPLVVTTPGRLAAALRDGRLRPAMLAGPEAGRGGGGGVSASNASANCGPLRLFVIDEADLLLALPGYAADVASVAPALPRGVPAMLLSATAAAEVDDLTALVLHAPVVVDVTGGGGGGSGAPAGRPALFGAAPASAGASSCLTHHYWDCPDAGGRLAALVALLKLDAVKRRVLIFVATDAAGVRARLALAAFGLRAARLGSAMPLNSRHHALAEFNKGVFDYLIATDDGRSSSGAGGGGGGGEEAGKGKEAAGVAATPSALPPAPGGRRRPKKGAAAPTLAAAAAAEFGVVRGVDFKGVRTVINFDAPPGATSYVHRAGRAGRAGEAGAVVTLFQPAAPPLPAAPPPSLKKGRKRGAAQPAVTAAEPPPPPPLSRPALEAALTAGVSGGGGGREEGGGTAAAAATTAAAALLPGWSPYPHLSPAAPAALRYRVDDVARGLTPSSVREALAQELRRELLNSARLASHFAARPADLALLRHDAPLTAAGRAAAAGGAVVGGGGTGLGGGVHLARVPAYLRAAVGVGAGAALAGLGGRPAAPRRPAKKRARAGPDPLKNGGGGGAAAPPAAGPVTFAVAPRRGHAADLTPAEAAAEEAGRKAARKAAKKAGKGGAFAAAGAGAGGEAAALTGPRRNTLKGKHRRR